ncbi:MAG TPA: hypothetical protein VFN72_10840 [Solirubrobacterales bacterium]|nr:hypothetical protein [Solirubrobacterales bacterium]
MSGVRVVLANENVPYAGVVSFDGEVFEALGFADTTAYRMPIELIDEVELDDDYLNVLSNPEKGDSYGIQLPIKPSDEERAALQELVDAIRSAAEGTR